MDRQKKSVILLVWCSAASAIADCCPTDITTNNVITAKTKTVHTNNDLLSPFFLIFLIIRLPIRVFVLSVVCHPNRFNHSIHQTPRNIRLRVRNDRDKLQSSDILHPE